MNNQELEAAINSIGAFCFALQGELKAEQVVTRALIGALAEHEPALLSLVRAQIPNAAKFADLDEHAAPSFHHALKAHCAGIDLLLGL